MTSTNEIIKDIQKAFAEDRGIKFNINGKWEPYFSKVRKFDGTHVTVENNISTDVYTIYAIHDCIVV